MVSLAFRQDLVILEFSFYPPTTHACAHAQTLSVYPSVFPSLPVSFLIVRPHVYTVTRRIPFRKALLLSLEGSHNSTKNGAAGRQEAIDVDAESCASHGERRRGAGASLASKRETEVGSGNPGKVAVIDICDDDDADEEGAGERGRVCAEQEDMTLEELRRARLKRFGN